MPRCHWSYRVLKLDTIPIASLIAARLRYDGNLRNAGLSRARFAKWECFGVGFFAVWMNIFSTNTKRSSDFTVSRLCHCELTAITNGRTNKRYCSTVNPKTWCSSALTKRTHLSVLTSEACTFAGLRFLFLDLVRLGLTEIGRPTNRLDTFQHSEPN